MTGWLALTVLAAGGAAAVLRYLTGRLLPVRPGRIPVGVLLVNVAGSLLGGAVLGLAVWPSHLTCNSCCSPASAVASPHSAPGVWRPSNWPHQAAFGRRYSI